MRFSNINAINFIFHGADFSYAVILLLYGFSIIAVNIHCSFVLCEEILIISTVIVMF